jgi:hypothetical protein
VEKPGVFLSTRKADGLPSHWAIIKNKLATCPKEIHFFSPVKTYELLE